MTGAVPSIYVCVSWAREFYNSPGFYGSDNVTESCANRRGQCIAQGLALGHMIAYDHDKGRAPRLGGIVLVYNYNIVIRWVL
jgi:hypothetical protein